MIKLQVVVEQEKKLDECGVIAIRAPGEGIAQDLLTALMTLQHRGQESAGMATHDGRKLFAKKGMGLANEVFSEGELAALPGGMGIGHVRYSTTGSSEVENAQPLVVETRVGTFAIGLNGNLVNYPALRTGLEKKGYSFNTSTDTECLAYLLAEEFSTGAKDFFEACGNIMKELDGAYCFNVMTGKGEIVLMRDPQGFRPLAIGKRGGADVVASETAVLDALGAKFVRYVEPGEVIVLTQAGMKAKVVGQSKRKSHCMFEWVYIARPDSIIEGKSVIDVRERIGEKLAALYPKLKDTLDVVVPVPDSGRSAAHGFARVTGVRFAEALQKNRYVHRTFIMPSDEKRKSMVKLKLNVIRHLVAGKSVALVDDSIVRGTTMKKLAAALREAGAREVHLLISCPPIVAPCFMGVDFPTYKELTAPGKTVEQIRKELEVDSLNYMTIAGLVECIGVEKKDLCLACLNEDYPLKKKPDMNSDGRCD
jgi:amidophosphoribosyltransferase